MKRMLSCLLLATGALACQPTNLILENQNNRGSIVSARWLPADARLEYGFEARLDPGESTPALRIYPGDDGETGPIQFELSVEGQRVLLVTDERFTATKKQDTVITLDEDTRVTNPALIAEVEE